MKVIVTAAGLAAIEQGLNLVDSHPGMASLTGTAGIRQSLRSLAAGEPLDGEAVRRLTDGYGLAVRLGLCQSEGFESYRPLPAAQFREAKAALNMANHIAFALDSGAEAAVAAGDGPPVTLAVDAADLAAIEQGMELVRAHHGDDIRINDEPDSAAPGRVLAGIRAVAAREVDEETENELTAGFNLAVVLGIYQKGYKDRKPMPEADFREAEAALRLSNCIADAVARGIPVEVAAKIAVPA